MNCGDNCDPYFADIDKEGYVVEGKYPVF